MQSVIPQVDKIQSMTTINPDMESTNIKKREINAVLEEGTA